MLGGGAEEGGPPPAQRRRRIEKGFRFIETSTGNRHRILKRGFGSRECAAVARFLRLALSGGRCVTRGGGDINRRSSSCSPGIAGLVEEALGSQVGGEICKTGCRRTKSAVPCPPFILQVVRDVPRYRSRRWKVFK